MAAATEAKLLELVAQELERETILVYDSDVAAKLVAKGPLVTSLLEGIGRLMENFPLLSDDEIVEVVDIVGVAWVSVVAGGCHLMWRAVVAFREVRTESGVLFRRAGEVGMVAVALPSPSEEGTAISNVLSGVLSASSISSCARETDR